MEHRLSLSIYISLEIRSLSSLHKAINDYFSPPYRTTKRLYGSFFLVTLGSSIQAIKNVSYVLFSFLESVLFGIKQSRSHPQFSLLFSVYRQLFSVFLPRTVKLPSISSFSPVAGITQVFEMKENKER